ncbi:MAG: hypothetical protein HUJ94_01715 [Bacteroidales bacterium]|nr:hypothetical protein [Bacteroidales bacterium]
MKRYIILLSAAVLSMLAASCQEEELNPESVIKVTEVEKNDFDKWLEVNFVNPYNIDFKYRFELNESDMNYYTIPAEFDLSIKMAHLVKYLCVDSYDEVAGTDFTRSFFPKMFFLIGEWEYKNNGTFILGTAEGGKKILLSGINYLDTHLKAGAEALNHYYIKTIHHEFTHILNQTKEFPAEYKLITGAGYVADSWSEAPFNTEYLQNGFISAYSQESDVEDFAEMLSVYITKTPEYWASQLKLAGDSAKYITAKLDIVRQYMFDNFNIDIDVLRDVIARRQGDVVKGLIDLSDITIK